MSIIASGTTTTTALTQTGNTDGTLQLQVNGTTPSVTLNALGAVGVGSTPGYGTSGQILTSSGSTSAPAWANPAAVNLTTGVTGTLPIANGGTNSTATPTAGGIGYGTGTANAYTAAGTSGQVLTSAGASAPTWSTLSGSPLVYISSVTANNTSAVIAFTSGITSTYDTYVIEFVNLMPASGTVGLDCQLSANGGSSYYTVSNKYSTYQQLLTTVTYPYSTSAGQISLFSQTNGLSYDAAEKGVSGFLYMPNPSATGYNSFVYWDVKWAPYGQAHGGGGYAYGGGAPAINAIKFLFSNGANFLRGKVILYGLKAS